MSIGGERPNAILCRLFKSYQILSVKKLYASSERTSKGTLPSISMIKRFLDGIISISLLSCSIMMVYFFVKAENCPPGYDMFLPFRGQCYLVHSQSSDWSNAQRLCSNHSGFLLEPYTPSEMTYVGEIMNFSHTRNVWLGASDHQQMNLFIWTKTGKSPAYTISWTPNFPSKTSKNHSCVSLLSTTSEWITLECFEELRFICKITLSEAPHHGS